MGNGMSTQFGGGADGGSKRGETAREDEDHGRTAELRDLVERIALKLNDAEERQAATLGRMLSRVEALGAEARSYKGRVPEEYVPAFERIEDGVGMLADRIASAYEQGPSGRTPVSMFTEYAAPASLGDSAEMHAEAPVAASEVGVAAFEPAPVFEPVMANDETAWDQEAADALAAHYENAYAGIQVDPHDAEPDANHSAALLDTAADAEARLADSDLAWLDERLVDIARKVEQSMSQSAPYPAMTGFDARLDQLEQRFEAAMGDVATRSDVEGLRLLEAHIVELSGHFEAARQQFDRLETIEETLAAVAGRLSDMGHEGYLGQGDFSAPDLEPMISAAVERIAGRLQSTPHAIADLESLADAAAERVAERFVETGHAGGGSEDAHAIRQLLDQFINERREGEEHTAAMLDTMQQAMIRVLDRVDALELTHSKAVPQDYSRDQVRIANDAMAGAPRSAELASPYAGRGREAFEPAAYEHDPIPQRQGGGVADRHFVNPTPIDDRGGHVPDEIRAPSTSPVGLERMRQDFIADARRAKVKASGASGLESPARYEGVSPGAPHLRAETTETVAAPIPIGKSRPKPADAAPASASLAGALRKPSRKLLVSAILLMIAIPGAMMLLKKRAPATASAPAAIERSEPAADRNIVPVKPAVATPPGPAAAAPATGAKQPQSEADEKSKLYRQVPETKSRNLNDEIQEPSEVQIQRNSELQPPPAAESAPPAGITVAQPSRAPTLTQLARLEDRQATARLSHELGAAQVNAVPAALIPEFMREATPESAPAAAEGATLGETRRQALDLPPANVGPLSLRLAAAKGDPSAEFEVGARFAEGKGMKQDLAEARRWYQRSAARGFAQSQYRLATFYERGLAVKQDHAQAKIWYQRSAEQGNVKAMHNLAVLSAGNTARAPDYAAATKWFQAAADFGLADSQFNLAVLHESGLGAAKDTSLAYKWFALAARQGDGEAQRRVDELGRTMQPAELQAAKAVVANWRPKTANRLANDPLAAGEAWKSRAAAGGEV